MIKSTQLLLVVTVFILVSVPLTIYLGVNSDQNARNPQAATLCKTNCNSTTSTTTTTADQFKPEDLNKDGKVNGGDMALLLAHIGKNDYPPGDLNSDGVVNKDDLTILVAKLDK